ncbi:putative vacuolar proton-translocating ATPase subunit [Neospora caninum Liverpool]|uniref:Putative vacuolar proton-translocating ATPase subunit n=1 Tax=Neospora caninum (strain Liverpool) TaxID=572307 RepID=F0VC68_NEOCL|nr:putative vacuolar proton-translocating ATPase subunit [Neospora caninum Liverpool]CBZ51202.1 putative vacuolar proton-translocating ATPase subunit [Neospora caninum Liverpool]CEL68516.1 TPA: vacuolar proton-translocating ATPase subunit,putative [Neospora caninum Liverpool]|eukprot:XP_003881235.1 putative vacuolar proton-translocating ATPase subunit [Neospora caninum Liverpool]
MGIFRSETMCRGTLVLPSEGARDFLDAIGSRVQVQFVDMNAQSLSRQYKRYVQRLEEMERILRFLFSEIEKHTSTKLEDRLDLDACDSDDSLSDCDIDFAAPSRPALRPSPTLSGARETRLGDRALAEAALEEGGHWRTFSRRDRSQSRERSERREGELRHFACRGTGGGSAFQLDKVEEALNKLYTQFVRFSQNNEDLLRQRNAAIEETSLLLLARHQLALPVHSGRAARLSAAGILDGSALTSDLRRPSSPLFESTASLSLLEAGTSGLSGRTEAGALGGRGASPHVPQRLDGFGEELGSEFRSMAFSSVAGVINSCDQEKFARALFRSMRGNAYTYFQPADLRDFPPDYATTLKSKSLFVTYYQGGRSPSSAAYEKVIRLCAAFNARCYAWPSSYEEAEKRFVDVSTLLADKEKALQAYEQYFLSEISILLEPVDMSSELGRRGPRRPLIEEWRRFCVKEKAIYATLNFFEASDVTIRADCWFPAQDEAKLRVVLAEQSNKSHASAFLLLHPPASSPSPPTFFRLPPFLTPFQQLVDTYGVPRYKEANPAVFACVFFPFLFGVMYGDVGHGLILVLIAAGLFYIKANNRVLRMKGEMIDMLLEGRHLILLLGVFATYAGIIYNDVLSLGVDLFGSRWQVASPTFDDGRSDIAFPAASSPAGPATFHERDGEKLEPMTEGFPYPVGFDPAWKGAVNELLLFNSFKMKFSVIVAFFQMLLGIVLKALNALYFRQFLDFFFEALPQLFLFVALIGYMTFLILFKWLTPVDAYAKPSLINVLIDMHMGGAQPDPSLIMFDGQAEIQQVLRLVVVLCIPVMLLAKPLWQLYRQKRASPTARALQSSSSFAYQMHRPGGSRPASPGDAPLASPFEEERESLVVVSSRALPGGRGRSAERSLENGEAVTSSPPLSFSVSQAPRPVRSARRERRREEGLDFDDDRESVASGTDAEEQISEVFIHQMIETIEFVLGTISNTASYLRLWALSLAHQQLALVFFEKTIGLALQPGTNGFEMTVKFVLLFPVFALITFFVMVGMDSLECFLHALRLQWVEFQGKFFKADGHAFAPLNFNKILRESRSQGS